MILVDDRDRVIGAAAKLVVHREGRRHRAFSVFVFNAAGELLLQQRAVGKYHSGNRWSNTCCGHPRLGEATPAAAARRLQEEMGFTVALEHRFELAYQLEVGGGLHEHEYNHVFTGQFDGVPHPDPREVQDWRWADPADVIADLRVHEAEYAAWFGLLLHRLVATS